MMRSYIWSQELIEQLIMLWEQHEVLYASVTTDQNCKRQRLEALNEIYEEMYLADESITLDIVKMKLHTLRSQFFKEFKRLKEYRKRGLNVGPKLEWYDHLTFLEQSVEGRPAIPTQQIKVERSLVSTPISRTTEPEVMPLAKKRKASVEDSSDEDYLPDVDHVGTDNEEKEAEAIHDWLEKKIDDLKAKLEKQREYKAAKKSRKSKIKKETDIDDDETEFTEKPRSFKWLSEQVVFKLNDMRSQRLQENAAWAIQKILHETMEKERRLLKNRNVTQSTFSDDFETAILQVPFKTENDEDSHMSIEQLFLEHFD